MKGPNQLHASIKAASLPNITQITQKVNSCLMNVNIKQIVAVDDLTELKQSLSSLNQAKPINQTPEGVPSPSHLRLTAQPYYRKTHTAVRRMPRPLFLAGPDPMI